MPVLSYSGRTYDIQRPCQACLACRKWCLNEEVARIALQAGHASPVKWCLKEKVLLWKWSAIAMLELQRIRFAGWALTEGQHRPKAGKKKKTREAGLFFLVEGLRMVALSNSMCSVRSPNRSMCSEPSGARIARAPVLSYIVDVHTIHRYHNKNASPVKWCLNEKVELLCKLAMPRLSSGV